MSKAARLTYLTHLLAGPRRWHPRELAERFEVSERTVFRDLRDLEKSGIPIACDEGRYFLVDGATLRPLNLTGAELGLLRVALENPVLQRPAAVRRTLEALKAKLGAATARIEESPEALLLAGIDQSGKNAEKALPVLQEAIGNGEELEALYASLSGGSQRWRPLAPYRVFHRGGAWYLAALCRENGELRLFRLDRILDLRRTGARFEPPREFNLDALLASGWGVFVGSERHEVRLRFAPQLAPLIVHANHHPGERITELADGRIEYEVTLNSLDEIARWVAGFGGGAEVLAPEALRDRVVNLARRLLAAHGETC
ncbi:MAG: WYL domain-containing protein [Thermoanaerobaculia bacterium]|nr:WYL domain-containing protein [Thermoanaerobaculia bacterium]